MASLIRLSAARKSPLFAYLTLLLWVVPLVFMRSAGQSLMAHDEGIYAMQARSILETGDWVTLQWGGQISFDRTIGMQWLIALSYRLFGVSEAAARLPSQLAFIGSVLLLYRLGELILRRRSVAWLAAAILAVMPLSVQYAQLATQDTVLVLLELLAAWAFVAGAPGQRPLLLLLAGACFGWGFMIKGFMVIPVAIAFLPYLILQFRQHFHLLNRWFYLGLLMGWLPVVAWLWAATQKYGMLPINELFFKLSYLQNTLNYAAGPLYYFWNIPANAFPWAFFAIGGMVLALRNWHCYQLIKRHWALALGFPLTLFVELTLFKTRTHYYPLQLLPWLALWAAICLDRLLYLYRLQQAKLTLGAVSAALGGLGAVLTIAGCLGFADRLPPLPGIERAEILRVSGVALTLGLGWLALWVNWLWQRPQAIFASAKRWLIFLLAPLWLALALLNLTGLWGDYAPGLKAMLRAPTVAPIVQTQSIDFITDPLNLYAGGRKRYLLLSLYTPYQGRHLRQWTETDLAWVDPNLAERQPEGFQVLAEYYGWELLQRVK